MSLRVSAPEEHEMAGRTAGTSAALVGMALVIWIALIVAYFWSVRNLFRMGWPKDVRGAVAAERPRRIELIEAQRAGAATALSLEVRRPTREALARRSS